MVKPIKKRPKYEKFICAGKLRIELFKDDKGNPEEIILLSKQGGCEGLHKLVGGLTTLLFELDCDLDEIIKVFKNAKPCTAPMLRMKRENLDVKETGLGGCGKVILQALEEAKKAKEPKQE